MVQWSCEIPPDKLEDFAKFAKEKLKPFHESYDCKRVELFMPMEVQKKYFPYQTTHKRNRYIEQLIFNDLKAFEDFRELSPEYVIYKRKLYMGIHSRQNMI